MNKKILLYYKYVSIPNPQEIKAWQQVLCQELKLTGRIILATEGINGTVYGALEATQKYINAMNTHDLFKNIDFKDSVVNGDYEYFTGLRIVVKPEIVSLGIAPDKLSTKHTGQHLTPEQAHDLISNNPDLILLDGRNYYEAKIGTFKNAITPQIEHFRDFPDYIDQNLEQFKNKEVLMFCTGGIRCERASAYLNTKNIAKKVYQIEGGIHRYIEQYPDGYFRGKNYVFDARIATPVNNDVIGRCDICTTACDDYTNCQNALCNKQFLSCSACIEKFHNCCSSICTDLVQTKQVPARPYRPKVDGSL
jgi:predicted sulfurtransferase